MEISVLAENPRAENKFKARLSNADAKVV